MTSDTHVYLELPWPPSTNTYWRYYQGKVLISEQGRKYRRLVQGLALEQKAAVRLPGRLRVRIFAHPPDKRKRDLDNLLKALLDSIQHAGVYQDDSQIDDLWITREAVEPNGVVFVNIDCQL